MQLTWPTQTNPFISRGSRAAWARASIPPQLKQRQESLINIVGISAARKTNEKTEPECPKNGVAVGKL